MLGVQAYSKPPWEKCDRPEDLNDHMCSGSARFVALHVAGGPRRVLGAVQGRLGAEQCRLAHPIISAFPRP